MAYPDDELYDRMLATLFASWRRVAEGSVRASVRQLPGATAALFPAGPERGVYNNAVLERGLREPRVRGAVDSVARAYSEAGIERYAIWAHESEPAALGDLAARGFEVDTWTAAMAMPLDQIAVERPHVELGPSEWQEHLRYLEAEGVPGGLLAGVDGDDFHVLVAKHEGENVATAIAYDHEGDCGIFNTGTLPRSRRRGLATALTALHLQRARERGCETASLQATELAQGVYARVGFRGLGRFIEYVPSVPPRSG
jgi:ribosomal protein S18 acetylase RimI-like enzyme